MDTLVLKSELETASDIDLLDVCLSSGDFADLAKVIQGNGYRGTRKFRTFSGDVTAFNSTIAKGESVDVVVTDSLIYDKGFDYGFVKDGVAYSQNGGKIVGQVQTRNLAYSGSFSGEVNGVTISYDNGTFTFDGTATAAISHGDKIFGDRITLQAGTYTISIDKTKWRTQWVLFIGDSSKSLNTSSPSTTTFTLDSETICRIGCYINAEIEYDNYSVQVQIEQGDTATDWVPPLQDVTYTLQHGLKFDGAHYVDSGLPMPTDTNMSIDLLRSNTSDIVFFGAYCSGQRCYVSTNAFGLGNKSLSYSYNWETSRYYISTSGETIYINGISYGTISGETYAPTTDTLFIGCQNNGGTAKYFFVGIVYSAIINGRPFVPCADEDETQGLLDLTDLSFHPLTAI